MAFSFLDGAFSGMDWPTLVAVAALFVVCDSVSARLNVDRARVSHGFAASLASVMLLGPVGCRTGGGGGRVRLGGDDVLVHAAQRVRRFGEVGALAPDLRVGGTPGAGSVMAGRSRLPAGGGCGRRRRCWPRCRRGWDWETRRHASSPRRRPHREWR